jgi:two-component system alkaline phosphatase synthesis response regulator PhoP
MTERSPSHPRRILVVDDSVLIREAAKIALAQLGGFEVTTAGSGEEGLVRAAGDRPDAILLDVVMPGIDGVTTAERLTSTPATSAIPIVLLTAKDEPEDRERFRLLPVRGVIAKPFELAELSGQVERLLGWS